MTIFAAGYNQAAVGRANALPRVEVTAGNGIVIATTNATPTIPLGGLRNKLSGTVHLGFPSTLSLYSDLVNPFMVFKSGGQVKIRLFIQAVYNTPQVSRLVMDYTQDGTTFIKFSDYIIVGTIINQPFTFFMDMSAGGGATFGSLRAMNFKLRKNFSIHTGGIDAIEFPPVAGRTLQLLYFIFHDEMHNLTGLNKMSPTGPGTTNTNWSNANFTAMTDTTTFASPTTDGALYTLAMSNPNNSGTYDAGNNAFTGGIIKYLINVYGVTRPTGTPAITQLASAIRSGGTNYVSANQFVPVIDADLDHVPLYYVFETDPATGLIWTQAGMDAVEVGARAQT